PNDFASILTLLYRRKYISSPLQNPGHLKQVKHRVLQSLTLKPKVMENSFGKRFAGKVAIVTASTLGIGFGIAQRLGLEGASVVISSRRQSNVDEAVESLRAKGIEAMGVACHVCDAQQRKNLIQQTLQVCNFS
ncbi:hypothetical protein V2J09_022911, partial [Rumex salicifolius]